MRFPRPATFLSTLAVGAVLAAPELGTARRSPDAGWHPGVQAGRLQLASPPGSYVDLGAPLTDREAADLAPYRRVVPEAPQVPLEPARTVRDQ